MTTTVPGPPTAPLTGQRATIRDVAALSGYSIATVSKALNKRPGVSEATRKAVGEAAAALAFRPNQVARSLLSGASGLIGLLTEEPGWRFSNPVLTGIENHGAPDMSVLLCDGRGDPLRERHHLQILQDRRVDGIVMVGPKTNPRRSITSLVNVPLIYAYTPSIDPRDTSLVPDDTGGGRLATEHLLGVGRTRLAYIGGDPDWKASHDRAEGFQQALAAVGLAPCSPSVHGSWSQRWGRQAAHALMASRPDVDGIFCGSDAVASGVLETLHDLGVRVPDDVAVAGFDNWALFAEESRPALTTVDMNLESIGDAVVSALVAALEGRAQPGVYPQPCRLVVRASTSAL